MELPKGLTITEDFISPEEEQYLIRCINSAPWNKSLPRWTQHYGFTYNYQSKDIIPTEPIPIWIS
jgi:hypothetical protein